MLRYLALILPVSINVTKILFRRMGKKWDFMKKKLLHSSAKLILLQYFAFRNDIAHLLQNHVHCLAVVLPVSMKVTKNIISTHG